MNIKKVGFLSGTVLVALLLAVLIIAYVLNIRGESDKNSFHQDDLYTVSKRNITSVVSINGNVRYSAIEKLSFPVGGEIETIFVREGQIIAEGAQLAELDKEIRLSLDSELAELQKLLQDAVYSLDHMNNFESSLRIADVQKKLWLAKENLRESKESLDSLTTPSDEEISTATMEILNRQKDLSSAEEALLEFESENPQTLADLEHDHAIAVNNLDSVEETYEALMLSPDVAGVENLERIIESASTTLYAAVIEAELSKTEWQEKIDAAEVAHLENEENYILFWRRWFGVEDVGLLDYEPAAVYGNWGIDLDYEFDRNARSNDVRKFIANFSPDHGPNVWSDISILTWLAFYPGVIHGTCDDLSLRDGELCVDRELNDAWDTMMSSRLELEKMKTLAKKNHHLHDDNVRKARDTYQGQLTVLEDFLEGPKQSAIAYAKSNVSLAKSALDSSKRALDQAYEKLLFETELQKQLVDVLKYQLADAEDNLTSLLQGPNEFQFAAALADVTMKENEVAYAEKSLLMVEEILSIDLSIQESEVNRLTHKVSQLERKANDTLMKSPFISIVLSVLKAEGDTVNSNEDVLEIADSKIFDLEGFVDEIDVLNLSEDLSVLVRLDASRSETFTGTLVDIGVTPVIHQGVVSYPVKISLDNPDSFQLLDGLSGIGDIIIRESLSVISVPISAIHGKGDNSFVLLKSGDDFIERRVTTGHGDDFWVAINDGLKEGDQVIVENKPIDNQEFNIKSLRQLRKK